MSSSPPNVLLLICNLLLTHLSSPRLNCASISHDGSLVAGGFSDSSIKVSYSWMVVYFSSLCFLTPKWYLIDDYGVQVWDMAKIGQAGSGMFLMIFIVITIIWHPQLKRIHCSYISLVRFVDFSWFLFVFSWEVIDIKAVWFQVLCRMKVIQMIKMLDQMADEIIHYYLVTRGQFTRPLSVLLEILYYLLQQIQRVCIWLPLYISIYSVISLEFS